MINVINLHHHNKQLPAGAIPVHRPNPLGNPFERGDGDGAHNRQERIDAYKRWLWEGLKQKDGRYHEIRRLAYLYQSRGTLDLACWCSPHACHGDVVAKAIEWMMPQLEKLPARYAGIGPRKISDELVEKIESVGKALVESMQLSSGGAPGADQAFARGACATGQEGCAVIHLPWSNFERGNHPTNAAIIADVDKRAYPLTRLYHPNPAALSKGAATLTARNAAILFGKDLSIPVRFVLYGAPGGIEPAGGTSNCLRVARAYDIPTIMVSEKTDIRVLMSEIDIY